MGKKRMRLKWIGMLAAAVLLLAGCGAGQSGDADEQAQNGKIDAAQLPLATNLAGGETADEVCEILQEAGASNVETFRAWIDDFANVTGDAANLAADWTAPGELSPDLAACMNGWEGAYDYSDSDCRMTAFLLLGDVIKAEKTAPEYSGTYLMFDVDAIENTEKYEILKEKEALFATLFGEWEMRDPMAAPGLYGKLWEEYGLQLPSEKLSLLSIVICDEDFGMSFVGHTGVLVDCGDHVLFVEKIAFEQPYQATRAKDIEELRQILGARPEYFGDANGPFLYQNEKLLGPLEQVAA